MKPQTKVQQMRAKIIAFLKANGGQALRSDIRDHLGIEPYAWSSILDKAVKTKSLIPLYGMGEVFPGLFLSRKPVLGYRLAKS